jgi:hypothetical protein
LTLFADNPNFRAVAALSMHTLGAKMGIELNNFIKKKKNTIAADAYFLAEKELAEST